MLTNSNPEPVDDLLYYLEEQETDIQRNDRAFTRLASRRDVLVKAAASIAAFIVAVAPLRFRGRIFPNTIIDDIDVSGQTLPEVSETVQSRIDAWTSQSLILHFEDRVWQPTLSELGFSVDVDATVAAAWEHGRSDGITGWYTRTLGVRSENTEVSIIFQQDDRQLDTYLASIASELGTSARDARLVIDGEEIIIRDGAAGLTLSTGQTKAEIVRAVQDQSLGEVALFAEHILPQVTASMLEAALQRAQTLVRGAVRLQGDGQSWQVRAKDLLAALVLPDAPEELPFLDGGQLEQLLKSIEEEIARPARNARLQSDGSRVSIWEEGTSGRGLDMTATIAAINTAAQAESSDKRVAELVFSEALPEVRADTLEELGLVALLGSGSSSFEGSPDTRRENVHVAARHVSRTLIPPTGNWSFNERLGPITPDEGYVSGRSIQGNWFADDIGGGVCQISTTVFRAALFGGFRFPEWHYHGFRVMFYELDGWSPGIDAAIYQPNGPGEEELDLIILNPTDSWAFLQLVIDGDRVTAELYGTPPGYDTVVDPPKITAQKEPPAPVEREDRSLAKGQRQMLVPAVAGCDVFTVRRFLRDGETLEEQTFASYYQPQPEMWIVGPQ